MNKVMIYEPYLFLKNIGFLVYAVVLPKKL